VRKAYGEALAALGETRPEVVVLSADVSNSDFSYMFQERFPDRFFNVGIAEPCLVDVAVGFAREGKIPFANTFAFLLALRAAEAVRTSVCFSRTNVKLAAAYSGLSDSFDGPTHHAITDIALMRALPNMTVVVVADATEATLAVPAVAAWPGPVFLRLSRAEVPVVFGPDHVLEIGRGQVLRPGDDVTLVGTGLMIGRCLDAADALHREGISARVVEIHTVKPLDAGLITACARETGCLVTAEEHSIIGGLGSAVIEALSEVAPVPVVRIGLRDTFATTGPYFDLLEKYGLGVPDIVAGAKRALARK
jgi:transketolase